MGESGRSLAVAIFLNQASRIGFSARIMSIAIYRHPTNGTSAKGKLNAGFQRKAHHLYIPTFENFRDRDPVFQRITIYRVVYERELSKIRVRPRRLESSFLLVRMGDTARCEVARD